MQFIKFAIQRAFSRSKGLPEEGEFDVSLEELRRATGRDDISEIPLGFGLRIRYKGDDGISIQRRPPAD